MKIFYIMNVEWNWIKQRPHFLAEHLVAKYGISNVCIATPMSWRRKNLQKRTFDGIFARYFYHFPLIGRIKIGRKINAKYVTCQIHSMVRKFCPDMIFLCGYDMASYVPKKFKGKVIYDCMDDIPAFPFLMNRKKEIIIEERRTFGLSDVVFSSSDNLKGKLIERYGKKDIFVVRNGFSGKIITHQNNEFENVQSKKERYQLCYFGTISNWFDWDIVLKSLDDFPNIEYIIIGPIESGVVVPKNDRIKYTGVVEHEQLYNITKNMDCFIMPFIVNDLILSVDPVKIYEYINFNRNILMVKYPEVERFEPFVYFYTRYDEYYNQLQEIMSVKKLKYSEDERINFLKENSWESRAKQIFNVIESKKLMDKDIL